MVTYSVGTWFPCARPLDAQVDDIFSPLTQLHFQERESSWWFFPTHLKNMKVKLDHFPKDRGENKTYLKPQPSCDVSCLCMTC